MSDEYRLSVCPMVELREIASTIEQHGMRQVLETAESLRFAYPSLPPDQVARWGGNIILEREDNAIRLVLNGVSPRLVLKAITTQVERLGRAITIDEV